MYHLPFSRKIKKNHAAAAEFNGKKRLVMLCFWILPFKKVTKTLKGKILWLYQILFTLLIRDKCSLQAPMPSHSGGQVMQRCLWVMPTQTIKQLYQHKILCILLSLC